MKKSVLFMNRQDVLKNEMIECIKDVLIQKNGKLEINQDDFLIQVGYKIDCECFDDLINLHISGNSVEADLINGTDVELNYFHESSLIDIIEYLEKHGYLPLPRSINPDKLIITCNDKDVGMDNSYKPQINDKLWISHRDRRDKKLDCYGTVTKVEKKYFYVKTGFREEERFYLEDFTHENGEYSSRYILYKTEEECLKHEENIRRRRELINRLFQFLTNEEIDELYNRLILRDM